MKKISKILACILLTCLLITQSLTYRYTQAKAIATEVIVIGGAGLLAAAAFTYGYVVKNHSVVEEWADDWQNQLNNDRKNDWERMKKSGIISGGLLGEAGEFIKEKIEEDRETVEQEVLADGIVTHGTGQFIEFKNYNWESNGRNYPSLIYITSPFNIPKGSYIVCAGMFVDDAELSYQLKSDALAITTFPLTQEINVWTNINATRSESAGTAIGYTTNLYCKEFERGSKYYVYSYRANADGLTFEQVRDIYTQAIAGGVYKTEKVFEQVASDEYVDQALSGDYSLAPSNAYEMTITNEQVEEMTQTVTGAQEDSKAEAWAEAMTDVGAVAVDGDVALDVATAQSIPYADVIAATQVNAASEPSKWQFPLTAFFPFCIPFDIYNMLTAFKAEPEAPHYTFKTTVRGTDYGFTVDLSPFNSVAAVLRKLELVAFSIGLAFATNKLIKH